MLRKRKAKIKEAKQKSAGYLVEDALAGVKYGSYWKLEDVSDGYQKDKVGANKEQKQLNRLSSGGLFSSSAHRSFEAADRQTDRQTHSCCSLLKSGDPRRILRFQPLGLWKQRLHRRLPSRLQIQGFRFCLSSAFSHMTEA